MAKSKLKWFREGHDRHEDLYLIPVGQERNETGEDLNMDAAVAWIKIAYDRAAGRVAAPPALDADLTC